MAKKTGFDKVIGRRDYVVREALNKIKVVPFKEMVTYLDFTSSSIVLLKK